MGSKIRLGFLSIADAILFQQAWFARRIDLGVIRPFPFNYVTVSTRRCWLSLVHVHLSCPIDQKGQLLLVCEG